MSSNETIAMMLDHIEEPNRTGCRKLLEENKELFQSTYGSVHNHQTWEGGYYDHIREVMNLGGELFCMLKELNRPLSFTLSDVYLVMFLHDIEKPWKYEYDGNGNRVIIESLRDKEAQHQFRKDKLGEYGITLNSIQANAMRYVEGENRDYSPDKRVMNELAAICHCADLISARIFYDYPALEKDPWSGAFRCKTK